MTKQFATIIFEKVNVTEVQGKDPNIYDSNIEEQEKYIDRELEGF